MCQTIKGYDAAHSKQRNQAYIACLLCNILIIMNFLMY